MIQGLDTLLVGVRDMDAMTAFYRDVLGLTVKYGSPYFTGLDMNGIQIGLHAGAEGAAQNGWKPCFVVDDLRGFRARLLGAGAPVEVGYHDTPRGALLDFRDIEGNPWQALQLGVTAADLA